ncbi:esterase-like activity of phytase family protein [Actibacterium sp. 188UL27-1]|uniref:esterase-like activity of phytase family protein n=1 Tax=Actibacterium sp. 188UL27-1 TaxID=2786961 RepID=UPI00195CE9B5|nr:esterase-like activity of phytase family protein [Actibacterium sp. 188UL27-1]MBM7068866.1 esterase-like activity of phytase family protein [Actibacterium sp. 188UL27-1]
MRLILTAVAALCAALPLTAQEIVPSTLVGHAFVPANTMSVPPDDAPRDAWVSGKFTAGADQRQMQPMQNMRDSGLALPFIGQPFQGISGYAFNRAADDSIIALIDNGFGSKLNSSDALLSYTRLTADFETGAVTIHDRFYLHDPDFVVPFRIAYEASGSRYLTGADFDLESIQVVGDTLWIGEEFGPYLISATLAGKVTGVYPTLLDGAELRSPDHPALSIPAVPGEDWVVPRSGGYEGMALTPDQSMLWAMLEKPILAASGEAEGGFLRVLAFDPATAAWTGDNFKFALTEGAVAIGDFNFIDDTRALVIERDGGQGDPSLQCETEGAENCFEKPAQVKRITLIDTSQIDDDGFVARLKQIDLMDIDDPDGLSRVETSIAEPVPGKFTFPFVTIESVIRDGEEHIIVGNDNNLPFSTGRMLGAADNNEMIRLHVPELLAD